MAKKSAPTEDAPPPHRRRRWLAGLLVLTLLGSGGGGAAYYVLVWKPARAAGPAAAEPLVTSYFAFEEAFTCNLAGSARLIQVKLSVSTTAPPTLFETIALHDAPLRAAILAVLMEQTLETVTSRPGKQALSGTLRDTINAELARRGGGGIDEVFVTDLIIQ